MPTPLTSSALFDGKTVFRFSHGFDQGGGIEQYLDDVNTVLLSKHRLRTIQLRLTTGKARQEDISINGSTVTNYYVPANVYNKTDTSESNRVRLFRWINNIIRDRILYQPFLNKIFFRKGLARRHAPPGICDPFLASETVRRILASHNVDAAVFHSFGNYDSQLAIQELKRTRIPIGLINHFSNDRFSNSSAREQVLEGDLIGSVARSGMPGYLAGRCEYVGDGIDTEFYQPSFANEMENSSNEARVLLPARLVASKGHLDLVAAAKIAKESGVLLHLYFAGRSDSEAYKLTIEESAEKAGLSSNVHFLGAQNRSQMRDWYAACILTVLPTHHHEGLPRISLEAQSMRKPIIAYDIGGVKEGLIDQKTGILVPLGNIDALAGALVRLVKNPRERIEMGDAGFSFIRKHYSYQSLLTRHETFLGKLFVGAFD
jgi:glycosyltransferase involved in cell wall biosynthesis